MTSLHSPGGGHEPDVPRSSLRGWTRPIGGASILGAAFTLFGAASPARAQSPPPPDPTTAAAEALARVETETPAATPLTCRPGWETHAFVEASGSVVRVKTARGWGAGFFFEDSRTVVTALHVVERGRWVQVMAKSGAVRRARVVHNGDQELDLAVLELETPFPEESPPLRASPALPTVGMPVLMIGHPGPETGGWSVSWGRVGSEELENGAIEVDGTANPGNSGGPLLDCEGRVLGVVSYLKDTGVTMAVPIRDLPRPGDRYFHSYRGVVATAARFPSLAFSREGDHPFWGVGVGVDVVLRSRWLTALQGQYQWRSREPEGAVIDRRDRRWQLELLEEYRFSALGTHGIGLGVALSTDYRRVLTGAVDTSDPSAPALSIVEDRDRSTRLRPLAVASWSLGPLFASYAFQLDLPRPDLSAHQVLVGLRMENVLSYE